MTRATGCYTLLMQFQVPQFIEVEDKIFGPLTFKQFVYVGGGLGADYILWRMLPIYIAGPLMLGIAGLAAALAFFSYNGRPFILALESAFYYITHSRLYLWDNAHKQKKVAVANVRTERAPDLYIPKLSDSRLHELAWSLDIKERIAAGTNTEEESPLGRPASERPDMLSIIRTAREAQLR
jgi:hypothetical protein